MDNIDNIQSEKKFKHLDFSERLLIQKYLQEKHSIRDISQHIKRSASTISREIKRNKNISHFGKEKDYNASKAQTSSDIRKQNSKKIYKLFYAKEFVDKAVSLFRTKKLKFDIAVNNLKTTCDEYNHTNTVCTKTMYNYYHLGLLEDKKDNDIIIEHYKKSIKRNARINKRKLGSSIEERERLVETREEFGHWECDLVMGKRGECDCLLTLIERKTRFSLTFKLKNKKAKTINRQMKRLLKKNARYFLSITTDNGSEFYLLDGLCRRYDVKCYFTHPFSSWEKGSIERYNRIIRRFIPKKTKISDIDNKTISNIVEWTNTLPRKILGYKTPLELFEEEISKTA